ncbi:TIM barrel protein [uncultured Microbulbifer sp.]|uniref:sugar phosphate isomerase/epimerase family protein n=1 Tax=uncultured Microbulbifer sp. TaxID=348147 RepID=UPI00261D7E94|nr:TIM barrel protein [uncultured Microbulbifer sp.]
MRLDFFCTYWGSHHIPLVDFVEKVLAAGYRGIETPIPDARNQQEQIAALMSASGIELIAQVVLCKEPNYANYRAQYLDEVTALAELKPRMINCHTGRDYFSREQNLELIGAAQAIADQHGVPIVHETHRGRFSFNPWTIEEYLDALPELRLTADFSHWCVVSESLLEHHPKLIQRIAPRCGYIHARVGHSNGPQIVDPRSPHWQGEVDAHIHWWQTILDSQEDRTAFAITPEFGPPTYMPVHPQTNAPLVNQWDINLYMKDLLQEKLN